MAMANERAKTMEEEALWERARLHSLKRQPGEAYGYLVRLMMLADSAEKKATCYLAMGQSMEQMRDYASAIIFYSRALALEPVNNDTWYFINNNLGYCLNQVGRYE